MRTWHIFEYLSKCRTTLWLSLSFSLSLFFTLRHSHFRKPLLPLAEVLVVTPFTIGHPIFMDRVALYATFLHIQVFECLTLKFCFETGGIRIGFSSFFWYFLEESWSFKIFFLVFGDCSVILHLDEAVYFFSLSTQTLERSFLLHDFINSCKSYGLLEISSKCPFFFGVLCTLEERLCMPKTGGKNILIEE